MRVNSPSRAVVHAVDLVSCPSCGRLENRSQLSCSSCGTRLPTLVPAPVLHPVRTVGKKILIGGIGFTVGPVMFLLTPYWVGSLFLGLFTTLVGYAFGILYIIYGGNPGKLSRVRVLPTTWYSDTGPSGSGLRRVSVPGFDSQTEKIEDREDPEKRD